jgi:LPS export ABC transporter protein LptC
MKRIKISILICFLLTGIVVLVSLWANLQGRKASEGREKAPKISLDGADTRMEKIRFVEDKHGQKTWELEATSIQQYQGQNVMVLQDVNLTFYAKDGRTLVVTGKQGKVWQDTKNMELVGNVIVTSSDGYRLRTRSVNYHHEKNRVTTSDAVELDGDQIRMTGTGMIVDVEEKTVKILSRVRAQWREKGKG